MDLDAMHREFQDIKRRVMALESGAQASGDLEDPKVAAQAKAIRAHAERVQGVAATKP